MHFDDITSADFWLGVAVATLCGVAIGFEREVRGKSAGMRTSALVCVGTYLFVTLSMGIRSTSADPTRVLGQVVTGIGFLGAGVILTQKNWIKGVTSAAVIWNLAAIGAATGLGRAGAALGMTAVVLLILTVLRSMAHWVRRLREALQNGDDESDD